MIPEPLLSEVSNHLWQSTVFAAPAGLLTLALRKNHARTRYWLWMAASVKFLIPFSLLIGIGSHLGWRTAAAPAPQVSVMIDEIGQPFGSHAPGVIARTASSRATNIPQTALLGVWGSGFAAVMLSWWMRWRRVRSAVRASSLLGMEAMIPVMSSPSMLEPGVFGVLKPVLLLPEGIADRLKPEELRTIFDHELCHVRRRDNLAAVVHMAVEAIFWFHPLVWWLETRLIIEREQACDEEVLRLGNSPEAYAEGILKTCRFYLESRLVCVSGVTGADLKKRIEAIMTNRLSRKLDFGRRLLLAVVGIMAIAGPILIGILNAPAGQAQSQTTAAPRPKFEVASIKLNKSADPYLDGSPGWKVHSHRSPRGIPHYAGLPRKRFSDFRRAGLAQLRAIRYRGQG